MQTNIYLILNCVRTVAHGSGISHSVKNNIGSFLKQIYPNGLAVNEDMHDQMMDYGYWLANNGQYETRCENLSRTSSVQCARQSSR